MKSKIRAPKVKRARTQTKAAQILEALNNGTPPKEIKNKFGASIGYIYALKSKMAHRDDTLELTSAMEVQPGEFIEANSVSEANNVNAILNERGKRYGDFLGHAAVTQQIKSVIFAHLYHRGKNLSPDQQEALDMIAHKVGRIVNGDPDYVDSWVDIAGYAKLVADRLEGRVR